MIDRRRAATPSSSLSAIAKNGFAADMSQPSLDYF